VLRVVGSLAVAIANVSAKEDSPFQSVAQTRLTPTALYVRGDNCVACHQNVDADI
jgi:hypothetical protein